MACDRLSHNARRTQTGVSTGETHPMPSVKAHVGTRRGRGRNRSACAACRQTKRKCDGEMPCGRYASLCAPLSLCLRGLGRPDACSTFPDRQAQVLIRLSSPCVAGWRHESKPESSNLPSTRPCDNVTWRVQVQNRRSDMRTLGDRREPGGEPEVFAGICG